MDKIKKIVLLNFGLLKTEKETKSKVDNVIFDYFLHTDNIKFILESDKIEGKIDLKFGIEYYIEGFTKSKNVETNFICKIIHPLIVNPNTNESAQETIEYKENYLNKKNFDYFSFEFPWELKKGIWTFQIIQDDVVLLTKSFEII